MPPALTGSDLITPLNLWSLWVPGALLGLVLLAALYAVQITRR